MTISYLFISEGYHIVNITFQLILRKNKGIVILGGRTGKKYPILQIVYNFAVYILLLSNYVVKLQFTYS